MVRNTSSGLLRALPAVRSDAVEPASGWVGHRAERDRRIVELRRLGWSLAEIARSVGLSYQRVGQIVEAAGGVDRDVALAARFDAHVRRAEALAAEILARYRYGVDPQRIARDLGLDNRAVKGLVGVRRTDRDRSARARALAAGRSPRFSDEELLAGVRRVAGSLGRAPSGAEYDRLARELSLASLATVVMRFGAWRAALSAAGLTAAAPTGRVYVRRWSPAACRRALEGVAEQLGDPPRYSRYVQLAAERDDLPSGATVRQQLGLWSEIAPVAARRARDKEAVAA